jgi:hypothetical protein
MQYLEERSHACAALTYCLLSARQLVQTPPYPFHHVTACIRRALETYLAVKAQRFPVLFIFFIFSHIPQNRVEGGYIYGIYKL